MTALGGGGDWRCVSALTPALSHSSVGEGEGLWMKFFCFFLFTNRSRFLASCFGFAHFRVIHPLAELQDRRARVG